MEDLGSGSNETVTSAEIEAAVQMALDRFDNGSRRHRAEGGREYS
jgi:hypothetical protein